MFGTQRYREGEFTPEGRGNFYHVHCHTGAQSVLSACHHVREIPKAEHRNFSINFANGSYAHIQPGDELWETLKKVAQRYDVYVYILTLKGGYVRWTGDSDSLHQFDCILIQEQGSKPPKNLLS